MRLGSLLQRVNLVNLNLQLSRFEEAEQLINVEFKFLAGLNVAEQLWPSNLDTLRRQFSVRSISMRA